MSNVKPTHVVLSRGSRATPWPPVSNLGLRWPLGEFPYIEVVRYHLGHLGSTQYWKRRIASYKSLSYIGSVTWMVPGCVCVCGGGVEVKRKMLRQFRPQFQITNDFP